MRCVSVIIVGCGDLTIFFGTMFGLCCSQLMLRWMTCVNGDIGVFGGVGAFKVIGDLGAILTVPPAEPRRGVV